MFMVAIAAEFLREIDGDAGADAALAIEELGMVVKRHDRAVPDVGMNIESAAPVAPKCPEMLRSHIVARQCQRHDETLTVQRIKQLAAIGVIIGPPDQRAVTRSARSLTRRLFRPVAPAKKVAVADGVVSGIKGFAFPPEFEQPRRDAALIARILVDRAPALGRPTDNLDRVGLRLADKAAVSLEALITGGDEGRFVRLAYPCRRHIGNLGWVKFHDSPHSPFFQPTAFPPRRPVSIQQPGCGTGLRNLAHLVQQSGADWDAISHPLCRVVPLRIARYHDGLRRIDGLGRTQIATEPRDVSSKFLGLTEQARIDRDEAMADVIALRLLCVHRVGDQTRARQARAENIHHYRQPVDLVAVVLWRTTERG